jgi:prepilin-type N-terminal cleavage/methylation domain-containing protein
VKKGKKNEAIHHKAGFTLVEIMIVVATIGLLAGIGIPSFNEARKKSSTNACLNNLRQMEGAKQMAAMEQGWGDTDGPNTIGNPYYRDTCSSYLKRGQRPVCPTGANCFYNALNESPTCQSEIAEHIFK